MIGVEERRIRIVTEFFEKGKEKIEKSSRRIVETSEQQVRGIKKVHSIQEKVNGRWVEQSRTVKKGIPIIKRFQAQYLSLMFTGMAVYRTFGGIVKTQTELWGINEGFSAMLSVVMIPVMEWLSDVLWPIFDWFMELPEPIQKVIGFFILLGVVVGALAMVFGMFMLALTATGIGTAISLFGSFLLVIFGIGIILWGVIDIVTNFGKSTVGILKGV